MTGNQEVFNRLHKDVLGGIDHICQWERHDLPRKFTLLLSNIWVYHASRYRVSMHFALDICQHSSQALLLNILIPATEMMPDQQQSYEPNDVNNDA